jgi:Icc-related predicted phosphoesterase
MRLLFVTDLHGDTRKYERTLEVALSSGVEVVINGGDMLPKGGASRQAEFITGYLEPYFARYDASGVYHLGFLGNDDLRIYDQLFERICLRFPRVEPLAQRRVEIGGYQWVGFNWVPDFPFRLKDRARKDSQSFSFPRQFGTALLSAPQGMQEIPDWFAYADSLPTVAEELRCLERPTHMARAVYVIHTPPSGLGLDVTATGERVGSTAIYDFGPTSPCSPCTGISMNHPGSRGAGRPGWARPYAFSPANCNPSLTSWATWRRCGLRGLRKRCYKRPLPWHSHRKRQAQG